MIDETSFNEQQIAQVRQIAREEMSGSIERVMTEIIDKRLAGVPTVQEMTLLFERQQRSIHEFITSTDLYLRRAESKFNAIDNVQRGIDLLTASINTRNEQIDDVQHELHRIDGRVNQASESIVTVDGKYDHLKQSIFGDPSAPEMPSLVAQLHERSHKADQQHEEIKGMLKDELKPMIERANQRLVEVELFIARQRQWLKMGRDAVKFVASNPKWIVVIFGGGAASAIVIEFVKSLVG